METWSWNGICGLVAVPWSTVIWQLSNDGSPTGPA
jgi:hypothetical protein